MDRDTKERAKRYIHARSAIDEPTGCWGWTGSLTRDGYGQVGDDKLVSDTGIKGAHRLSYAVHNDYEFSGRGEQTRHRCRNRRCINPAHLLTGTAQDNADDRVEAGTTARGERDVDPCRTSWGRALLPDRASPQSPSQPCRQHRTRAGMEAPPGLRKLNPHINSRMCLSPALLALLDELERFELPPRRRLRAGEAMAGHIDALVAMSVDIAAHAAPPMIEMRQPSSIVVAMDAAGRADWRRRSRHRCCIQPS
jgi:hypothetical protein